MENLVEKNLDLEDSLLFPIMGLIVKQEILNTSSYFEKEIPNTDDIILRLYL